MASLAQPAPLPTASRWNPRRIWQSLQPAEGWSSVLLLAIMLLATAWTITRTEIDPDGLSMGALALGGLLTGLVLAKSAAPDLLAHLLAILSGVMASVILAVERMPLAAGGRSARAEALLGLGQEWYATFQAGGRLDDPRLLAIMLGAAVWLIAYTSAWVLFRRGWLTTAVALPTVIALANLGYSPEQGTGPLLVIVLAAILLTARHAAYRRQVEWTRLRLPYPRRTVSRFLAAGLVVALLGGIVAWTLPLSARDDALEQAWAQLSEPLAEVSERWNDLLARLSGGASPEGGSYSAFGESFDLGGNLNLSDDPVMVLEPSSAAMQPTYLAGQRYDEYTGHGWTTTVDDTFNATGPDGKQYSSRLSFRSGQGVHLSPEVTTGRSTVEGILRVIRPKGDLMFTIDTYLAADRRTNVQVSWEQLDNVSFPLANPAQLPLDLQRMGVLVSRGSYQAGPGVDSPLPAEQALAADIQTEREALRQRFLDVRWQANAQGQAEALIVSGQLPVYDDVESVFSQTGVAADEVYEVTGLASTASPDTLRGASTDYPAWVTGRYLQLPDTITDRTRALANELVSSQPTVFDAASAVEQYVRTTIAYREDIDTPPDGQDVVDYVLFDSQEGYCEYYASAMAVLLRAEGIPTRVVGGYYPAPYDADEGGNLYREKNAHLWVEVFFPEFGWIPFEPTANRDELQYGDFTPPPDTQAEPTPVPTPEPTPEPAVATPAPAEQQAPPPATPSGPQELLSNPARVAGWVGIALLVALLGGTIAAAVAWFGGFRGLSPVSGMYARVLKAGNWLGVPPAASLTPQEFAERVGRVAPSAQGPVRTVSEIYTQELYGRTRPDANQLERARSAWRELRGITLGGLFRRNRGR
ncbi:MAG: transglutaminase domain-containing protein [Thermomicrobiales bacterium]